MNALGTFEVTMTPQESATAVNKLLLEKVFHGDLEAVGLGEMLSFIATVGGSAGYVALEVVTGKLAGREGAFALQHSGLMNRGSQSLSLQIIPDSGTLELTGIAGAMQIERMDGVHRYALEYELPALTAPRESSAALLA